MCIDKAKSVEFLKQSAIEMKVILSQNWGIKEAIETFQKENEILKAELDRVNMENKDLHAFIDSISVTKGASNVNSTIFDDAMRELVDSK
jgi:3-polyprenyl-4-hydroxybenzoate decarboxylase